MGEDSQNSALNFANVTTQLKDYFLNILSRLDFNFDSAIKKDKILFYSLIFLFFIALVIRLHFSFIIPIIREDALEYFYFAKEFSQGNFTPPLDRGIGLSLWESFFLLLFGSGEILHDINVVKALSAITGTLLFIPIALISNKLFNRKVMIISLVLYTFQPWLIINAASAYTEPLFTLILLLIFYFLLKSTDHIYFLFLASIGLSFLYMTRINGILLLPVILIYTILIRNDIPGWKNRYLIYIILIFIIVLSPYHFLRWFEYGSSTDYGVNSNFFAENAEQAKSPNYEGQSFYQFISTHSPSYILKREGKGLIKTIDASMSNMLLPVVGFSIIGLIFTFKRKCSFIHITYATWIIFFSWIFTLFPVNRFFYPLIPLSIILASLTIAKVSKQTRFRNLTIFSILIFLVLLSGIQLIQFNNMLNYKEEIWKDGMEWTDWIVTNIEPNHTISIREGGDLIELLSDDIIVNQMPQCDNLSATMKLLQEKNTDYLIIGDGGGESPDWERVPVFKEVYFGEYSPEYLELVYSNLDSESKWKVQVYRINWNKFNE